LRQSTALFYVRTPNPKAFHSNSKRISMRRRASYQPSEPTEKMEPGAEEVDAECRP
jgi:hypothetical protein